MKKVLLIVSLLASLAFAGDKMLVSGVSPLSVDETALKLQNIIKDKGLKIFGMFEHSKLAKEVNLQMNDTVVVAFGAPKAGTPLMQCEPGIALELPLKMLIYKNSDGNTIVAYDDIKNIAKRYNANCDEVVNKLSAAQANFFKAVTE
ncbi:DUF302 domain-containing protein [Campylobacter hyointestinalis]|uniref:DUF302 domain-containing protein n=1 Tax=Campylobacter hyointestinalis TaxID=198 RepID=UPI000724178A|nr:DUF302 domain-containing protein [Campylobacter hyointestinalis]PPB53184.1 hypothetical protein CDQ68_00400 [Campylobacter hyointestinalis subsp. hyointestinalis]PPB55305.1 hypothetical protein CDQ69_00995 [Campylobacter hyointestinalis subsp. hyointestinalis]PPB62465.1 hypothetical protein CDQ72_02900 [Campylobacter hyointestinalis subsp. hyointestinalis]PPB64143.1 hypothetical protein CDQ73_04570 [Campylobacter hyointestinalis subsp. hyointestinalis]PPB66568.1 hypothetical protein CDQ75_0